MINGLDTFPRHCVTIMFQVSELGGRAAVFKTVGMGSNPIETANPFQALLMDKNLSERIAQANEHLFLLLGALPDQSWHHRIIRAPSALDAHKWWVRQTGHEPDLVLVHHELEAALAGLVALVQQAGASGLWGGWLTCKSDSSKFQVMYVSADDYDQAHEQVIRDCPQGYSLSALLEATPWIAEIARIRAVAAGQLPPDEDLMPAGLD